MKEKPGEIQEEKNHGIFLRSLSCIQFEGLGKTVKNFAEPFLFQDSNWLPPKYKSESLLL
jgi:hypothetical protein